MKNGKVHIVLIVIVLVAVVTFVSLSARSSSRGVAVQSKTESTVKPTSRVTDRTTPTRAKASTVAFAAAASQNAALRNELTWTFGGKQQLGWSLYELLIGKTLKTQEDAG